MQMSTLEQLQTDAALQAAYAAIDAAVPTERELIGAKCRGLITGYHARWKDAGYRIENIEYLVQSNLWNPETEAKSRSFTLAGKLDAGLIAPDNRRIIMDHKTTSEDISDPNSPYWRQLAIEGQASHYMLLEWLNGRKADGALWDVVRKPQISPKKLSKAEVETTIIHGQYCRTKISDDSILELQQTGRETLEMYALRLAADCITERPQWYFQRRPVPRLDDQLHEYALELWDNSKAILATRQRIRDTGRLPARHSGACMLYHTPCKFLGICSGYDDPESDKWAKKANVHSELPELEGDGRDILTNSRLRTHQLCPRKHYYAYDLGIEQIDEEEREALFFGNVWHAALAAWLEALKGETNGTSDSGSTDTGFVTAASNTGN